MPVSDAAVEAAARQMYDDVVGNGTDDYQADRGLWRREARRILEAAHKVEGEGLDDLRPIVDRCCEACSKGDNPESIAAYLWSNISAHLEADQPREQAEAEDQRAW